MARFSNEDTYDAAIRIAASNYAVPFELIKAIIGQESRFTASATRREVKLADQSVGLMQILFATAQGEGYMGPLGDPKTLTGLYEPLTNITYGTAYLASQLARANGNIPRAVSAYNGGWRPDLGFGSVATRPLVICLARDSAGKCTQTRNVPTGEFANQPYVNAVLTNWQYFREKQDLPPVVLVPAGTTQSPLDAARRFADESETGERDSGTDTRSTWTQIREAITCLFRKSGHRDN
jgi:hypothetical protein